MRTTFSGRGACLVLLPIMLAGLGCARLRETPASEPLVGKGKPLTTEPPAAPATAQTPAEVREKANTARMRFARALADYQVQVDRLQVFLGTPVQEPIALRIAIEDLGRAIEALPGTGQVDVARAATEIKSSVPPASALGTVSDKDLATTAVHSLDVAANTLLDVTEGPYAGDPLAMAKAKAFRRSVNLMLAPEHLRVSRFELLNALRRAESTLVQMDRVLKSDVESIR